MAKDKLLLEKIKKQINKAKVVSFDIFDTLLVRPYVRPVDLFEHMEKAYERPGFAAERKDAERRTRIRHKELEDITFDMIYDEIDEEFKDMKQKEMDWEEMVLRANPELKQVYDYALAQGKRVIITSDMYLPTAFLAKVLRKNGYDNWDKLYVSGDVGKMKVFSSLYQYIIEDLKVSFDDILHIGDNLKSDYEIPLSLGMKSILYKQVWFQFLERNKYLVLYSRKLDIDVSILLAIISQRWMKNRCEDNKNYNYWQELGYSYGGPLALGYMHFVDKVAKENSIDNLLFVARDGYTLQKIYNSFKNPLKNSYIYAPRFLNLICRLDFGPAFKKTKQNYAKMSPQVLEYFKNESKEVFQLCERENPQTIEECYQFIFKYKHIFENLAKKHMENYKRYLFKYIQNKDKIGFIDIASTFFSGQILVENTLDRKVLGFYSCLYPYYVMYNDMMYKTWSRNVVEQNNQEILHFLELFTTSVEYPIYDIDKNGCPVYSDPDKEEIKRAQNYVYISKGMQEFAADINDRFNKEDIFLSMENLLDWYREFISHPTATDIKYFMEVKLSFDAANHSYVPLFSEKFLFRDYIFHPIKTIQKVQKLIWKSRWQNLLLNFFYHKVKTPNYEVLKILGITINQKRKRDNCVKQKKLCGLLKTKIGQGVVKKYFFGIKYFVQKERNDSTTKSFLGLKYYNQLSPTQIKQCILAQSNRLSIQNEKNSYLIRAQSLHAQSFARYKGAFSGKDVVLVCTGPTVKNYIPIKNAIHIGVNGAIYLNQIKLDYLFIQDHPVNKSITQINDDARNYPCKKFYGILPDARVRTLIPAGIQRVGRYLFLDEDVAGYYLNPVYKDTLAWDLSTDLIADWGGTAFSAMQFILYTHPKRIFLVGCDASSGNAVKKSTSVENVTYQSQKDAWRAIRDFQKQNYPDVEIVSINPVGLRGMFYDSFTKDYIHKHPEFREVTIKIIDDEVQNV